MTSEDIEKQQKDALWAHRKAVIVAENTRKRVQDVATAIKKIGETLENNPLKFLPGIEVAGSVRTPASFPDAATPFVSYEEVLVLVRDLATANKAVTDAANEANRLGIPVK